MDIMISRFILWSWTVTAVALAACGDDGNVDPPVPSAIEAISGDGQAGIPGAQLAAPLTVQVTDADGTPAPGATVSWSVLTGGGSIEPASSTTGVDGLASAELTLGSDIGQQQAQAAVSGLTGSPVVFTATASLNPAQIILTVAGGGNNVPDRYSSDLWVHGNYAYTGTWNFRDELGNALNVWALNASGAPALAGTVLVPEIGTVSDVQVSDNGDVLVLSGEAGSDGGIYTYSLSNPAQPTFLGAALVGYRGVHTVTLSTIGGRNYAFAAMNPDLSAGPVEGKPALMIYDITAPATPTLVRREPIEPNYGIHDTFVRDGIAFVFAWDEGVIIYDVGNGIRGGRPSAPVKISSLVTAASDNSSPSAHNGWWFHNPVTNEQRYLFIGQEGSGVVGAQSSGDIHVVDVSDLAHPVEVATFHLDGAGTHNFWVDESRQILYAAYYNAGVVALDISGTLSGDLSNRLLSQIQPGGAGNTYTWGVQLANGWLYAID
ncbi:MAG TPA: Ig-like domain-containing protein, partial [Gemmatimonadales bacterium]|nr:Ig-like domain-containing protein [Gemmatimonadales bacterium]